MSLSCRWFDRLEPTQRVSLGAQEQIGGHLAKVLMLSFMSVRGEARALTKYLGNDSMLNLPKEYEEGRIRIGLREDPSVDNFDIPCLSV